MKSALLWLGVILFIAVGGFIVIYKLADLPASQPAPSTPAVAGSEQSTPARTYEPQPKATPTPQPPIARPRQAPQPAASPSTVYVSPQGKRYHATRSCRGLTKAQSIQAISLAQAKARGYTPCEICH